MTDEEIMLEVGRGQLDLLGLLFDRYHLKLYNYFLRMTRDASLSEDLTQNVFERIIRYRKSFRGDRSFQGWMYQIGRNIHRDHYRLNAIRVDDSVAIADLALQSENDEETADPRQKHLEKALNQLKPQYREVIILGWVQNLRYTEVAQILGITESNVKVRIHRAIKQLQKLMQKSTCL